MIRPTIARPEAIALGFGGGEDGFEGALLLFLGHSGSGILKGDRHMAILEHGSLNCESSAIGHHFDGIEDEIQKCLLELRRIGHDQRQVL